MPPVSTAAPCMGGTPSILIEKTVLDVFAIPVTYRRRTVGTRRPPRIWIVVTVNGSVVWTRFVTLNARARPNGPGTGKSVKMSGRAGTIVTLPLNTVPLLLITTGYGVPATALLRNTGTTKTIS